MHKMACEIDGFQWDLGNWPKCGKHGVSREEIEVLLTSGKAALFPGVARSTDEDRQFLIGPTLEGRWLFVVFTLRRVDGKTLIRPLSARYMHKKEVEHYAQQKDT
jgi:uncharacterized protein